MDWDNSFNLWGLLLLPWICNGSLFLRGRTRRKGTLGINGLVLFGRYGNMFLVGDSLRCFNLQETTKEGCLGSEQFLNNLRFLNGNSDEGLCRT